MRRTTTPLLAAALLLAGGLSAAEAAKVCKPLYKHHTTESNPTEALAKTRTVQVWVANVAKKHTLKFANWNNADSRKLTCSPKTGSLGVNWYTCAIEGKPCAYE